MIWRECGEALSQRYTGILLLHRHFGIIGRILDRVRGLIVQFAVRRREHALTAPTVHELAHALGITYQDYLATDATRLMKEAGLTPPTTTTKSFSVMGKTFDPAKPDAYLKMLSIKA